MVVFALAASLRKNSLNKKLVSRAVEVLRQKEGITVDFGDFREFEMPVYDGDLEASAGVPIGAKKLAERLLACDAIVLATPEYNGGIPGALKNALDWVSRTTPNPLAGKPMLLLAASPGAFGGVRGLWHTRVPFEAIGTLVHPEMFGLPRANTAFAEDGSFVDPKTGERLDTLLKTFVSHARAITVSHKELQV